MRTPWRLRAVVIVALAIGGVGCGMADAGMDNGDGGPLSCSVVFSVDPAEPRVGDVVTVSASVSGVAGVTHVIWGVTDPDGQTVVVEPLDYSETQVRFAADRAGTWSLEAVAWVSSTECRGAQSLDIRGPSDAVAYYRLRATPPAGDSTPAQAGPQIEVYGATPTMAVGTWELERGVAVVGSVRGPAGDPLAAYLRLTPGDGGLATELFAGSDGAFRGYVLQGDYELLAVPYAGEAPASRQPGLQASELSREIILTAGDALGGFVLDATGQPLAGAIVAAATGSLPTQAATTSVDGSFALRVRAAEGPLALTVIPPAGSGLPRLELGSDQAVTVGAGAALEIRYAATAADAVAFPAFAADSTGEPLAGAQVTFVAETLALAGTLAEGGTPVAIPAAARLAVVADDRGELGTVALAPGTYQVVVMPPAGSFGQGLAAWSLDVTAGVPATPPTFKTAALAGRTVTVIASGSAAPAVTGTRVVAVSRGVAGVGAGGAVAASVAADGTAVLSLSPTVAYDLVVDPPLGVPLARTRTVLDAGSAGKTVTLPPAVVVRGSLRYGSGAAAVGTHVAAFCAPCAAGADPELPAAESVTSAGGLFTLQLPDPAAVP